MTDAEKYAKVFRAAAVKEEARLEVQWDAPSVTLICLDVVATVFEKIVEAEQSA
jgi:hypothetical protein